MKLTYERSGNPDAAAIVFLHGMGMGPWMWHAQIRHFVDYDCFNVDLPGHGGSRDIAWDSFDQVADEVACLIDETIPDKPVHLSGMSLGAVVGLHLLARHPRRFERAVLTGAFAEAPPRWQIRLQGQVMALLLQTGTGRRLFARMLQLPAEAMPAYEQSIRALSIPTYRQIVRQIADYALPDDLRSIATPTLFVTGEKDIPINRHSVTRLARQVPEAVGVFAPGVHHSWNGENPALFNATARAWIEGQALPDALIPAAT